VIQVLDLRLRLAGTSEVSPNRLQSEAAPSSLLCGVLHVIGELFNGPRPGSMRLALTRHGPMATTANGRAGEEVDVDRRSSRALPRDAGKIPRDRGSEQLRPAAVGFVHLSK
jgi:hypothetical protein